MEDIRVKCKKCKKIYDVELLRTVKGYKPGICPYCGEYLKRVKEK